MAETSPPANPARARLLLLLLMLIPIGVVLLATLVFYTRIGLPAGTRNKGTLISPPLQINEISPQNLQGTPYQFRESKEQLWTFLVVHPAQCDDTCRQQFWEIRQTRVALGKYMDHIQRVWLVTDGRIDEDTARWLKQEHPDIAVLVAGQDRWQQWLQQSAAGQASQGRARFYLVDPRGFLMMYYSADDTYKDVITDMKFLLKGVE